MDKEIKISFCIHVYNEERCLERTLQRLVEIKKHSICPIEIVVADEGSTDKSFEIAKKYADKVVKDSFGSLAKGRNNAVRAATGEIVISMDPDVIIPFDLVNEIQKKFTPDVVAGFCDVRVWKEVETLEDRFWHWLMNVWYGFCLRYFKPMSKGECQIFRKKVWEKIGGYNENLYCCEDCDILIRISKIGKVIRMPKNCTVEESPARYRKWTYPYTYFYWTIQSIFYLIGHPLGYYRRMRH